MFDEDGPKSSSEDIQEELQQLDAETFEIEDIADLEQNPADGWCSTSTSSSTCSTCTCTSS